MLCAHVEVVLCLHISLQAGVHNIREPGALSRMPSTHTSQNQTLQTLFLDVRVVLYIDCKLVSVGTYQIIVKCM